MQARGFMTAGLVVAILSGSAARADAPAKVLTEAEKIEALIKAVGDLKDAKFVRNGSEYDAKDAAAHMRRKWDAGRDPIKTARDFIRLAGTKSSTSGKPYLIRFKDGKEVASEKFLSGKLDEIEKAAAGGAGEPAVALPLCVCGSAAEVLFRCRGRTGPGRRRSGWWPGRRGGGGGRG